MLFRSDPYLAHELGFVRSSVAFDGMSATAKPVVSPITGTVLSCASVGETVPAGRALVVIESMKMEHVVESPEDVEVSRMWVAPGDTVREGQMLVEVVATHATTSTEQVAAKTSDGERADVARLRERKRHLEDASRPEAVAKRREKGRRTARENLADLLDEGSFQE